MKDSLLHPVLGPIPAGVEAREQAMNLFAGFALQALLMRSTKDPTVRNDQLDKDLAGRAYQIAAAMLKERKDRARPAEAGVG
jgi:hypothetical protein